MKEFIEYLENGGIKSKGFINHDKKEGLWEYFFENGSIFKVENYKNGKLHGLFKRWFINGRIALECEYSNGVNIGKWVEYYDDGLKMEEGIYQNGEYLIINFWNEESEQTLKDGNGYKFEKYGTLEQDIYKQYFENSIFIKEEKVSSLKIIRHDSAAELGL